jgi:phospholipid/cholesterol/gamma-HCH transport system substrate-binding protein
LALKINNETKVGVLAAIATALLILGFNFLEADKIFNTSFELKAYYENVDGLAEGNPVRLNGLRVGQVKNIEYDNKEGSIQVIFGLDKGIAVPQNTIAYIASDDLLGSKAIKLDRTESPDPNMAKNGSVLEGRIEPNITQVLMSEVLPLKDTVALLLGEIERLLVWTNSVMDPSMGNKLEMMADNFVTTSRNLATTSERVVVLADNAGTAIDRTNSILKNVEGQNETISRIIKNAGTMSDTLVASSSDIKSIIARSDRVMASMDSLLASINRGDGTMGALLKDDDLYHRIDSAVAGVERVVDKFGNDPQVTLEHRLRFGRSKYEKYMDKEAYRKSIEEKNANKGSK